jgi:hypothetical protein
MTRQFVINTQLRQMKVLSVLFLIGSALSVSIPTTKEIFSNLPTINSLNFDKTLQARNKAVILFGARWCHNTQNFVPEFYDAYTQLHSVHFDLDFYFFDCGTLAREYDFCHSEHSVEGYPTLLYYSKGAFKKEVFANRFTDFLREVGVKVDETIR